MVSLLFSEKYVEKLFGVNKDRMSMDQMAVLLVSNVNESKGHSKYICVCMYACVFLISV